MSIQTTTLNIDGMTCEGCVKSVNNALQQVAGVKQANASLAQKHAVISFDDSQANEADLKQAIEEAGFEVV